MPTYSEIEDAFLFMTGGQEFRPRCVYDRAADRFLYDSDVTEEGEIPEDIEGENYVVVPHKNDLDLGRDLVFRFVESRMPDDGETVYRYFKKRGAYARFKDLLERRGLLQAWYDFENAAQREAIDEWCEENGIEVSDKPAKIIELRADDSR